MLLLCLYNRCFAKSKLAPLSNLHALIGSGRSLSSCCCSLTEDLIKVNSFPFNVGSFGGFCLLRLPSVQLMSLSWAKTSLISSDSYRWYLVVFGWVEAMDLMLIDLTHASALSLLSFLPAYRLSAETLMLGKRIMEETGLIWQRGIHEVTREPFMVVYVVFLYYWVF